jgi:sugar phosphate isomerase/epimerase
VAPHPRISVNNLSSLSHSLDDDIALWRALGLDHVGLISPKLEAVGWDTARDRVTGAGLRVSNLSVEEHVVEESLRFAASVGAGSVYLTSGGAGPLEWDEAAAAFCARLAPHVALADELGVRLAVEPTNPLRADISFVFCMRDGFDLARAAGIGAVLDSCSCWYERDLEGLVRKNLDVLALVQISDFALEIHDTPNRSVIGDGDVPLERLLAMLLDAGYEGSFDIEILGPRIEQEGYASAIARSVERASELLDRLGVPARADSGAGDRA